VLFIQFYCGGVFLQLLLQYYIASVIIIGMVVLL